MSSSPRHAPTAPTTGAPAVGREVGRVLQPFPYDSVPARQSSFDGLGKIGPTDPSAAETAAREMRARIQGREEGQAETRQQLAVQLERERSGIAAALGEFARDRAAYFHQVEGEVVRLAMSIARKILHREAQLDPMLLAAIVRVALEKIDGATRVTLHVHPQNADDWRRYLAAHLDPAHLPEIVEDPLQAADSCVLETAMGTAVVGIEAELKEIEQGLMDLLAARPGVADSSLSGQVPSSRVHS